MLDNSNILHKMWLGLLPILFFLGTTQGKLSETCIQQLKLVLNEAKAGQTWALHILDASTKVPSGIFYGSLTHFGNFDQCLRSKHPEIQELQGRYCRVSLVWENVVPMTWGVCVPSGCLPKDVAPLLQDLVAPYLNVTLDVPVVPDERCNLLESQPLPASAIVFLVLVALLIAVGVTCTYIEPRTRQALVHALSLRASWRRLVSTRREDGSLNCLHGLRVGSMLWVLLSHRWSEVASGAMSNSAILQEYLSRPSVMTVGNGALAVDTFFVLSGFLMCYSFLRSTERGTTFDVFKFYLYRYIRLAVPLAFMMFFYATLLPILGDGPTWLNMEKDSQACKEGWWTNLLFINNYYYPNSRMCIGQTWYLATDMQLAWLSPLLLLPLKYTPRAGLQLAAILIAVSCLLTGGITYYCGFPMSLVNLYGIHNLDIPEGCDFSMVYTSPYCRGASYISGILLAYFIFKTRNRRFHLHKAWVACGWVLSTAVCLTVVLSLSVTYQPDAEYHRVGSAFYAGLQRLSWALGLSWIIFACINGHGGLVDTILSWRKLIPLSRLTYTAYLAHMFVIYFISGVTRTYHHFNTLYATHMFLNDLIPVFTCAMVVHLLVESPSLAALRLLFLPTRKEVSETLKENQTINSRNSA